MLALQSVRGACDLRFVGLVDSGPKRGDHRGDGSASFAETRLALRTFQVDPDGGKLLRQGSPVKLQEQPLRVLCLLLEHPGEVVTREHNSGPLMAA